eukprot:1509320-Rhodomonas_salina.2
MPLWPAASGRAQRGTSSSSPPTRRPAPRRLACRGAPRAARARASGSPCMPHTSLRMTASCTPASATTSRPASAAVTASASG